MNELLMTQKARALYREKSVAPKGGSASEGRDLLRSAFRDLEKEVLENTALVSQGGIFATRLRSGIRQLVQDFTKETPGSN